MNIKLWIIFKEEIGFSRMIAEILQDRLEDYIDVYVGNAERIDPDLLVEESFDYLIIGDFISDSIPSLEIKDWMLKYREMAKKNNHIVKAISGFYIAPSDIKTEPFWVNYLQENIKAETIYPLILSLKIKRADLVLEDGALESVKTYTNDFIEFLIENKKKY